VQLPIPLGRQDHHPTSLAPPPSDTINHALTENKAVNAWRDSQLPASTTSTHSRPSTQGHLLQGPVAAHPSAGLYVGPENYVEDSLVQRYGNHLDAQGQSGYGEAVGNFTAGAYNGGGFIDQSAVMVGFSDQAGSLDGQTIPLGVNNYAGPPLAASAFSGDQNYAYQGM
jgi:hypothetical protein